MEEQNRRDYIYNRAMGALLDRLEAPAVRDVTEVLYRRNDHIPADPKVHWLGFPQAIDVLAGLIGVAR